MKRILVIDNYDSFVYNVVQLLREAAADIKLDVVRNDKIDFSCINYYDGIVLSPGPGIPSEAGQLMDAVAEIIRLRIPVLGICLGHQALASYFGGRLTNLNEPLHGHSSSIVVIDNADPILAGVLKPTVVGRYHSWVVDPDSMPSDLVVSSLDECGNVMSFYNITQPVFGVQFHPESYMSNCGQKIIRNWLGLL